VLLEGKNAIVYGGGGAIGGAAARGFAREGAHVFLAGRTQDKLDAVADDIRAAGGRADTAIVDALDKAQVDEHADAVAAHGGIHVSFNVINHGDVQGTPLVDMALDDFMQPVDIGLRTSFLTATAAGRHMREQGDGVILFFGGRGHPMRDYDLGGLQVGLTAIATFADQLAVELGKHGIRVLTLQTSGIMEAIPPDFDAAQEIIDMTLDRSALHRSATFADVGNVCAFAASNWARSMTGTQLNITCGTEVG
jgi:NAD(P)-dependent dehydrogenase (short-subunit alcohol dehydrogenase family)